MKSKIRTICGFCMGQGGYYNKGTWTVCQECGGARIVDVKWESQNPKDSDEA